VLCGGSSSTIGSGKEYLWQRRSANGEWSQIFGRFYRWSSAASGLYITGLDSHIQTLAAVAANQPQAAYAALTKSLQSEWTFNMRTNNGCILPMNDLECCLLSVTLFDVEVTVAEHQLFGLPLKHGGLGIINPVAVLIIVLILLYILQLFYVSISFLGTASFKLDKHVHCVQSTKALDVHITSGYFTTLFNNCDPV